MQKMGSKLVCTGENSTYPKSSLLLFAFVTKPGVLPKEIVETALQRNDLDIIPPYKRQKKGGK